MQTKQFHSGSFYKVITTTQNGWDSWKQHNFKEQCATLSDHVAKTIIMLIASWKINRYYHSYFRSILYSCVEAMYPPAGAPIAITVCMQSLSYHCKSGKLWLVSLKVLIPAINTIYIQTQTQVHRNSNTSRYICSAGLLNLHETFKYFGKLISWHNYYENNYYC